jgi:Leucine-rich repeat (LRR) protein
LRELPPSVFELAGAARSLDATNNRLSALPQDFLRLAALQRVLLGQNSFTAFPQQLLNLPLRTLVLDGNQLTSLPEAIGSFASLEKLSVSRNSLTSLPVSLGRLAKLKTLDVSYNSLSALPPLGAACLEELNASNNRLTSVPAELGIAPRLRALLLDDNQLEPAGLPEAVLTCSNLVNLQLHGNKALTPDKLRELPGWAEAERRAGERNAKRVAGGVLLGERGLDDGVDHS